MVFFLRLPVNFRQLLSLNFGSGSLSLSLSLSPLSLFPFHLTTGNEGNQLDLLEHSVRAATAALFLSLLSLFSACM